MSGFVAQGLKLVFAGVGLLAAALLTRLMRGVLFGVSRGDPLAFAAGGSLLVLVGVLSCNIPARRAARADPNAALRCE